MATAKFSLAWDAHKQNICSGLTALQQNGEFVDMTLAADGHHVKVHQMVMSLASPYLKEIITSVQTPHPVVFLTKVSYPVLSAILEYIYTGEVLIEKDCLTDLVEAARELQIKGLQDLKLELSTPELITKAIVSKSLQGQPLSEYKTKVDRKSTEFDDDDPQQSFETDNFESTFVDAMDTDCDDNDNNKTVTKGNKSKSDLEAHVQYTVSNQGALQMILNRCLYYLRYTSRKGPHGHRQWKCIDYGKANKCPAAVITKDDVVVKRFAAHNHPFHDKQILKKVRDFKVYSAVNEAEAYSQNLKIEKEKASSTSDGHVK